jgi:hypothetical protein
MESLRHRNRLADMGFGRCQYGRVTPPVRPQIALGRRGETGAGALATSSEKVGALVRGMTLLGREDGLKPWD